MTQSHDNTNRGAVTLKFRDNSNRTAALEVYNKSLTKNGLKTFASNSNEGAIPNYWSTETPYWVHADFAMTYDPCTCERSSEFWISLRLGDYSTINYNTSGQISQQEVKVSLKNSQFSAGTFVKNTATALPKIIDFLGVFDKKKDKGKDDDKPVTPTVLSQLIGSFGTYGKLFSLADYFIGLLKPSSQPAKPVPLVFNVKLNSSGDINWVGNGKTITLQNPGADRAGVATGNYTSYNHIMGVFNLIEPPVVNIYTYWLPNVNNGTCYDTGADIDCGSQTDTYKSHTPTPIKWALNPYSGIQIDKIEAAYVYTYPDGTRKMSKPFALGCFQNFEDVFTRSIVHNCDCQNSYATEGDVLPSDVHIQIMVSGTAPNGDDFAYTSVFEVTKNYIQVNYDLTGTEPVGCNTINPAAGYWDIWGVCHSSDYISRTTPTSVKPTDGNNNVRVEKGDGNSAESSTASDLKIAPNPTNTLSSIFYKVPKIGRVRLYVTDISGKVVEQIINTTHHDLGNFEAKFERKELAAGMYFTILETEYGRVVQKLIIQ